jgi:glucosamine--fructose-6-phosphate aminotransferase (isomerizing)
MMMKMDSHNPLWIDIQAQGPNLRQVIDHLYGPERQRLKAAARFLQNDKPIVFIGMGSAAYLCMPAEAYLGQHGRFASVIYASDALYSLLPALKNLNVVINTRSGKTVEVVKLSRALVEAKIPFLAITNEPDSPVAHHATHILWSNARQDDLVSINVVTAMMTTTLILAAEALDQPETLRPALDRLADALEETVSRASQQADEIADIFEATRPLYLLYRGPSKGSAYCGRLVLEEVARHPAVPMEAGEFRQGPIEVVDDQFGAMVFVPDGELGQLTSALVQNIRSGGGRVMAVGSVESVADGKLSMPIFPVAALPSHFRPVIEVVPAQILAYKLAERQGYKPGTVRYLPKVITSEIDIPHLP